MTDAARVLEEAFRTERATVLATITHRLGGDLALAEDVVQDAFVAAAVDWDRRGVPERPGAPSPRRTPACPPEGPRRDGTSA